MHVKCLLMALKQPEKAIDILVVKINLRIENEIVSAAPLQHWSCSGGGGEEKKKRWGWSHRRLGLSNTVSLLLCCFLILMSWV